MAETVRVGDLVVCASKAMREERRLALDVGLYLIDRRRDGLVFFAGPDRSEWIPKRALKAVAPDDPRVLPPPDWVVLVHRAMLLVGATEVELERAEAGRLEARLGCPGIDLGRLLELARLVGAGPAALRIQPGSMSRIRVVFPLGGSGVDTERRAS